MATDLFANDVSSFAIPFGMDQQLSEHRDNFLVNLVKFFILADTPRGLEPADDS